MCWIALWSAQGEVLGCVFICFGCLIFLQLLKRCRCRKLPELFSYVPVMLCIMYQGCFGNKEDWLFHQDQKRFVGEPQEQDGELQGYKGEAERKSLPFQDDNSNDSVDWGQVPVQSASGELQIMPLIFTTSPWGRFCALHFMGEETETQRGWLACPRSHRWAHILSSLGTPLLSFSHIPLLNTFWSDTKSISGSYSSPRTTSSKYIRACRPHKYTPQNPN